MKKLNIAIIILLLVFQTVLSPISVFADESQPPVTPQNESSENTVIDSNGEVGNQNTTSEIPSEDAAEVTTPEDETKSEEQTEGQQEEQPEEQPKGQQEEQPEEQQEGQPEEQQEEEQLENQPQLIMPLGAPVGYPVENMQADVTMSFSGLKLFSQGGTLITNATDLANYSGPKPKKGDVVYLNYTFSLDPTIDYGIGSTFTFQLPANMIEEYTAGSFNQSRTLTETGDWLAYSSSYNSATKTVTVTIDSELEQGQSGSMNFEFMAKFDNFADESELEQSLIIPVLGGTDVQLDFEFAPTGSGQLLTKNAGSITRDASGEVTIPWTVWVNTGGQKLESASLNDVPDAKHELAGNITVERYKIGLNGFNSNSPGAVDDTSIETSFPISLTDGYYAYKVTYNTVVTADPTASSMSYTNVATLTGTNIPANTTANGTQTVQYGPSLDKTRSGDKYNSTWTIKYNWLGQKIPADKAKLTDTLTGSSPTTGKHKIDYSSFKVYRVILSSDGQSEQSSTLLTKDTDYALTEHDYDFEIDFDKSTNTSGPNGEVTSAFKIVYDSELEDEFVTDANTGTITNTVTRGDSGSDTATLDLASNIFNKARGAIDYVNKTITWTLTINAEKDLKNFVIEDDFTTTNKAGETLKHTLTSWNGTDFYEVTGANGLTYTITDKGGSAPTIGNEGFKMEFSSDIPKDRTVTIRYKTKYDIKPNGGVATAYINTADATWDGAIDSHNQALDRTANYTPDSTSPTNNNGYKKVVVDNQTQEFSWRIGVNINKQDINSATLTDTLGAGHYIPVPDGQTLKDQITISKLNLTTEEGTKNGTLDPAKWTVTETLTDNKVTGFEITFINLDLITDNNEAYLIEYKTKDADDIFGQNSTNAPRDYTNTATLDTPHNGSYNYNATAKISNLANELIKKTATPVPASDIINWAVTVNASNSKLGNITLTDKPSSNQKILTNTFKKQEIKLNANGTSQNIGSPITVDASEIVLNQDGSFSLNLGELNGKGYVVTYSTFFMGDGNAGETISNSASIGYAGATAAGTSDHGGDSKTFKYSSSDTSASGVKGTLQLKKYKVNPLTGKREEFAGVKFELWNKNNTIKLDEGTTDADGTLTFEQVRYGKYTLREESPGGYIAIAPITITMGANIDITPGVDGKAYVIDNIEDVNLTNACPAFTLTVKDIDGNAIANKNIKLIDSNGNAKYTGTTNAAGQVSDIKRPGTGGKEVQAGVYTLVDENDIPLGTVTVKYGTGECQDTVQPTNSCPNFKITVKNENGNPRPNVSVTLKDLSNTVIATGTTNSDGQFIIDKTTPAGKYKLYEGTQYLGEVNVTYHNDNCQSEVQLAPKCETFELTVYDVDGNLVADGTSVTVKNKDTGNIIATKTTKDGVIELSDLEPGVYTVVVDGEEIDEFESNIDCKESVQPTPKCENFTVIIKDNTGIIKPGNNVIIKDKSGKVISTNKDKDGNLTFVSKTTPAGKYDVYDKNIYLGEIEVSYASVPCEITLSIAPVCPAFTLTINNMFGQPRVGVKVTITGEDGIQVEDNGSTEFITDSKGQITINNSIIKPGKYIVRENGKTIIGTVIVGNTCEAKIQPSLPVTPPTTNPGNPDPDPEKPVDPNKPNPDPEKPVDPNKPNPDPEKPVDPNKPNPDPEKPVDPNKPNPDPEKPVDPNKPNPDPEKPVDPNKPNPDPENPVEPNKPNTDSNNSANPGKTEGSKPSVQGVIDQGKNLPPYNPTKATKDTLDAYKDFLNKYSQLTKEEQEAVAESLDINKIKSDAKRLEAQLKAQGKLPQTDGADQTALMLIGVALILGALYFLRRRNAEVK
ncbi:collagen binding domain-containing protein [Lysinibacillus capsici]|uniref:collagen binding domain-containing protein n=1 Tax=Lysinibacillus capsici TaxID=2115968 RepID=UPI003F22C99C